MHREHQDLDYIVSSQNIHLISIILSKYQGFDYIWISDKWSYRYTYDDIQIEFETVESINIFVKKITNKYANITYDDIDFYNIYMLGWVRWMCMKSSYYYKLRDVFGENSSKNQIDKEILDKAINIFS